MGSLVRTTAVLGAMVLAAGLAMAGGTWQGQPYSLTVPSHVTARGGAVCGSVVMALDHDVGCTITVTAAAGGEVLTRNGQTLVTYYKLTGSGLGDGDPPGDQPNDSGWVDSTTFLTRPYHTSGPSAQVILSVKGVAPLDRAVEAGEYNANITITGSW